MFILAVIGLLGAKEYPETVGKYDFLILIPAHNEEQVIARTLESLKMLEPVGRIEIAVIADNCDDSTAQIARNFNVTVLERSDDINKGKGFALEWAIDQYDLDSFQAVAIVDADTLIESNMLITMAKSLESGAGAVQLYYGFSVEQKTSLSYLQSMANIVENIMFYKPRAILGLPILLRGTGMAIDSRVLRDHPWDSHSITEDVEYAVNLLIDEIKIDFNIDSMVFAAATSSYDQSHSQKLRWASGTFELIKNKMLPLMYKGIKTGRPDLIELGLSFMLLSRPLLIYIAGIAMVLGFFAGSGLNQIFVIWSLLLVVLLILYLMTGIIFISDKKAALKSLLQIPRYGFWFFLVQIKALLKLGKMGWTRTERKIDE
ncbi:MAG: glycosyltransferase [candidate division Zixibacteria bacterium]|nr:glycosyltransferase [candidate division Zixibacteria bacterium]